MIPADLRLRLVAAFLLVAALSQVRSLAVAAAALAVILAATLVLVRPDGRLWRRLLHVEGFVLLLFVMLPFTMPGEPILTLGPLTASQEGLARAALIACKISASVLILLAFLGAIDPQRMGGALRGLRVPEPLVRLEAMRARGFHARSNRHTWRSYGNLVGMVLVRALERAERVEEAMRARGYDGRFPYPAPAAPARRDWAGFAVLALLAAAVFGLGRL
ncbi:MAG: cobalt ECF transporter T component CbiQ [Rhizobiales bacterium]|nr:cobalt ECF transporter T component CbiQ [Hyphomicrobiales bacterium]